MFRMKKLTAVLLAALLTVLPAAAVDGEGAAAEADGTFVLKYDEIEPLVLENNPNLLMLEWSNEAKLRNDMMNTQLDYYWNQGTAEAMAKAAAINAMVSRLTDEDKELMDIQDQQIKAMTVSGAKSMFITYHTLDRELKKLEIQLANLDAGLATVKKQYEMGAASEMQVLNLEANRRGLELAIQAIGNSHYTIVSEMNLMLGKDFDTPLELGSIPHCTVDFLTGRDREKDHAAAIKNNFNLKIAGHDLDQLPISSGSVAVANLRRAARKKIEVTEQRLDYTFDALRHDIESKQAIYLAAEKDYEYQQRLMEEAETKYRLQMISDTDLETAKNSLETQRISFEEADVNLFVSCETYLNFVNGLDPS